MTAIHDDDLFRREDILKMLLSEYQYWRDSDGEWAGVASGAVANLVAFFSVGAAAEWHPNDVKPVNVGPAIKTWISIRERVIALLQEQIPPLAAKHRMTPAEFWKHGAKDYPTLAATEWHQCILRIATQAKVKPIAVVEAGFELFRHP